MESFTWTFQCWQELSADTGEVDYYYEWRERDRQTDRQTETSVFTASNDYDDDDACKSECIKF